MGESRKEDKKEQNNDRKEDNQIREIIDNLSEIKEDGQIREIDENLSELERTHNLINEINSLATPKEKKDSKDKEEKTPEDKKEETPKVTPKNRRAYKTT